MYITFVSHLVASVNNKRPQCFGSEKKPLLSLLSVRSAPFRALPRPTLRLRGRVGSGPRSPTLSPAGLTPAHISISSSLPQLEIRACLQLLFLPHPALLTPPNQHLRCVYCHEVTDRPARPAPKPAAATRRSAANTACLGQHPHKHLTVCKRTPDC